MKTTKKVISVLLAVLMCVSCFALTSSAVTVLSSINLTCPAPEADGAFPTAADVECATTLKVNSIYIYEVNGDTLVKASAPFEVGKTYEIDFTVATRTSSYNFDTNLSASVNDEACRAVYLSKTTANVVWVVTVGKAITIVELFPHFKIRAGEPFPSLEDFENYDKFHVDLGDGTFTNGRSLQVISADFYEYNEREELTASASPFKKGKTYVLSTLVCVPEELLRNYYFNPAVVPELELSWYEGNNHNYHDGISLGKSYIKNVQLSISTITPESLTVNWKFTLDDPVLTVIADSPEGGTVTGTGKYPFVVDENDYLFPAEAEITATPNSGYYFAGWFKYDTYWNEWKKITEWGDTNLPAETIYVGDDEAYMAKFVAYNPPDLTGFTKLDLYPLDTLHPSGYYFDCLQFVLLFINPFVEQTGTVPDLDAMTEEELNTLLEYLRALQGGGLFPTDIWYNVKTGEICYGRDDIGLIVNLSTTGSGAEGREQFLSCIEYAEPTTYTVTANASAGGSATGGNTYESGATATLTATPNSGYHFTGWYEGSTKVSDKTPYSFTVTKDVTLTAQFEKDAAPDNPNQPGQPDNPGNGGDNGDNGSQSQGKVCKYCGGTHTGFLGFFVGLFHSILALFGLRKK